ncbi:MAG: PaaX family transcriptional regulator [Acidimicrobiia bacterium]
MESSELQSRCASLVTRFRDRPDTSARALLVTVFGDVVEPRGGEVWIGSLVRLVDPLGINERLVRTSLNRLVNEGLLAARRIGRRGFYSVTKPAHHEFRSAEERIYGRRRGAWDGLWTVLVEIDELAGPIRIQLRQRLAWLGFGPLAGGVQACPADRSGDVASLLEELSLTTSAAVFQARALPLAGITDRALVETTSDLEGLRLSWHSFLGRFGPLAEAAEGSAEVVEPQTAFLARILLVHSYRRVVLREPDLPAELWPVGWVGETGYATAGRLYRALTRSAHQHVESVGETPDGPFPALDSRYRQRFAAAADR